MNTGSDHLSTSLSTLAARVTDVSILAKLVEKEATNANLRQLGTCKVELHVSEALSAAATAESYDVIVLPGSSQEHRATVEPRLSVGAARPTYLATCW